MTKSDILFAESSRKINRLLEELQTPEMEKLKIKIASYDIFQRNYCVEDAYHDLIEYLEEHEDLYKLIPEIENFYSKTFNSNN